MLFEIDVMSAPMGRKSEPPRSKIWLARPLLLLLSSTSRTVQSRLPDFYYNWVERAYIDPGHCHIWRLHYGLRYMGRHHVYYTLPKLVFKEYLLHVNSLTVGARKLLASNLGDIVNVCTITVHYLTDWA